MPSPTLRSPVGARAGRNASRFLFQWEAADGLDDLGRLVARTGQVGTYSRGGTVGAPTYVDGAGRVGLAGKQQPRFHHRYNATTGLFEPVGLLLEGARTNIVLQSENFGTTWITGGTPTRSAAAAYCGPVALDLLGDDDGAGYEYYEQQITFTGDAVKAFSFFFRQGTSTSTIVRILDNVSAVEKFRTIITWSGTTPVLTMSTGTHLATERLQDASGNAVYRGLFQTTSVTAANPHIIDFFMAADPPSATGNIYLGGVMAENATFPSSYIKTTTTTVTRSVDALSFAFNAVPQAMTVYAKITEYNPVGADVAILSIGTPGNDWSITAYRASAGSTYKVTRYGTDAAVADSTVAIASMGSLVEVRGAISADGANTAGISVDSAAEVTGSSASTRTPDAAFTPQTLSLSYSTFAAIRSVRIAAGVQTLDYMRAG